MYDPYLLLIELVMTIMQLANVFLTFAIVVRSSFASSSKFSVFALDACYLVVTALQVRTLLLFQCYSLYMHLEMIQETIERSTDSAILLMAACRSSLWFVLFAIPFYDLVTLFSIEKFNIYLLFSAAVSVFVILAGSIIHGQFFSIIPCLIQYLYWSLWTSDSVGSCCRPLWISISSTPSVTFTMSLGVLVIPTSSRTQRLCSRSKWGIELVFLFRVW